MNIKAGSWTYTVDVFIRLIYSTYRFRKREYIIIYIHKLFVFYIFVTILCLSSKSVKTCVKFRIQQHLIRKTLQCHILIINIISYGHFLDLSWIATVTDVWPCIYENFENRKHAEIILMWFIKIFILCVFIKNYWYFSIIYNNQKKIHINNYKPNS